MNNFNQFGYSYPSATQPYGYAMNWQPPQQPQTSTNKIYVSGEEDVKQRYVPANGDMIFIHNDKDILYQKKVDSSGHYEINVFDIVPHKENTQAPTTSIDTNQFVSKKEFDDFKSQFLTAKTKNEVVSDGTEPTNKATL